MCLPWFSSLTLTLSTRQYMLSYFNSNGIVYFHSSFDLDTVCKCWSYWSHGCKLVVLSLQYFFLFSVFITFCFIIYLVLRLHRGILQSLCAWDPTKRPTAAESLKHPFFQVYLIDQKNFSFKYCLDFNFYPSDSLRNTVFEDWNFFCFYLRLLCIIFRPACIYPLLWE